MPPTSKSNVPPKVQAAYAKNNPLIALAQSKGFPSMVALAAKMTNTDSAQLAPSNLGTTSIEAPVFERLAKALDMPIEELRPFSREGTGLLPRGRRGAGRDKSRDKALARKNKLQRLWRAKKKQEREAATKTATTTRPAKSIKFAKPRTAPKRRPWGSVTRKGQRLAPRAETLSVVHVANNGHLTHTHGTNGDNGDSGGSGDRNGSRAYHKRVLGVLHELPKETRETVKTFINTLNRGIMLGEPMLPPIPIGAARLLLEDYLKAKGVKITVLLDADYYEVFGR